MKKNLSKLGIMLKYSMCYGFAFVLISCNGDENREVVDDQTSAITEETGRFGGNTPTGINDALYSDFSAANYFENSDKNNDNLLDKNEFSSSLFDSWDTSNDGILNENEWANATNDYGFKDNDTWAWNSLDANNDSKITNAEFESGLGNADMFASWDKNNDNMLDEKEYAEGIVVIWNEAEADGVLDEEEYKVKVKKYYDDNQNKYMPEMG